MGKQAENTANFYDYADKLYHHSYESQLVTQYKDEKINYLATLRYKQLTKGILDKNSKKFFLMFFEK